MASTAGFRHNRLKRRHLEPEVDYMPENKRYFSEKIAQEMGVLKLDDHQSVPQSVGSPQSPFSSSPPTPFTPPPSPFHTTSYQPSSPSPFTTSSSPFQSSTSFSQPSTTANLFSQRFTPQNFQQQLQQLQQLHHPVNQYQLQQQLQNHQMFQMRQPSSPPTTPILTFEKTKPEVSDKALTIYQPFQFSAKKPGGLDSIEEEESETEKGEEKGEKGNFPKFTVHLPEEKTIESLIPLPHPEDLSKALILYSSPTEVIQNSIAKERRAKHKLLLEKLAQADQTEQMEDMEPETITSPPPPSSSLPSPPPLTFPLPPSPYATPFPSPSISSSPSSYPGFPAPFQPAFAGYPPFGPSPTSSFPSSPFPPSSAFPPSSTFAPSPAAPFAPFPPSSSFPSAPTEDTMAD